MPPHLTLVKPAAQPDCWVVHVQSCLGMATYVCSTFAQAKEAKAAMVERYLEVYRDEADELRNPPPEHGYPSHLSEDEQMLFDCDVQFWLYGAPVDLPNERLGEFEV